VSFNGSANINLPGVNQTGNQNTTGSAASLTTARAINGTNFNGTAAITTANWGTARNITIGGTTRSVNGSTTYSWSLADIGVNNSTLTLATSGIATGSQTWTSNQGTNATFTVNVPATNLGITAGTTAGPIVTSSTGTNATLPTATATASGVVTTGNQTWAGVKTFNSTITGSISGNSGTATTLQTARTINGTSFNGGANITTANWGTARTLWGQSVNGSANITTPLRPAAGSVSAPAFSTSADTNTGMFFPAADTIAFSEGGVERMRIDSSGNLRFNSGYGSVATAYGCRAWVNFNGTGTVAIRASGNVTSITDHAVGKYTVNFTTAMPDANYSVSGSALHTDGTGFAMTVSLTSLATPVAGSCRISVAVPTLGFADPSVVDVSVFR
jgi:hypothetical protein